MGRDDQKFDERLLRHLSGRQATLQSLVDELYVPSEYYKGSPDAAAEHRRLFKAHVEYRVRFMRGLADSRYSRLLKGNPRIVVAGKTSKGETVFAVSEDAQARLRQDDEEALASRRRRLVEEQALTKALGDLEFDAGDFRFSPGHYDILTAEWNDETRSRLSHALDEAEEKATQEVGRFTELTDTWEVVNAAACRMLKAALTAGLDKKKAAFV